MILELICSGCNKKIKTIETLEELRWLKGDGAFLCEDCAMVQSVRQKVRNAFEQWNTLGINIKAFTKNYTDTVICPICGGYCDVVGNSVKQVFCNFCHGYYYNTGADKKWHVYLEGEEINYLHNVWDYYPFSKFERVDKIREQSNKLDAKSVLKLYQKLKDLNL